MQNDMNDSRTKAHESTEGVPAKHTPTPWMTHRAGEVLPDDWMIMADFGKSPNGIQEVSTVARALSIRQTPETTAANAAFIVRAVNSHDALVEALGQTHGALTVLRDMVRDSGKFNGREYIDLGVAAIKALESASHALAIAKATS